MNGSQEFLTSQQLVGVMVVKLSISEALEHDGRSRDLMSGMLFENLSLTLWAERHQKSSYISMPI